MKKNKILAYIVLVSAILIFAVLLFLLKDNQKVNRAFGGEIFEESVWQLTWEELYEVSPSASDYTMAEELQMAVVWFGDRETFNKDIEGILQYLMSKCEGDFSYGSRGADPTDYISPPRNTGVYEEELSWTSLEGENLNLRIVRLGSGEDKSMKLIITDSRLEILDGEVIEIPNDLSFVVKIGDEEVELTLKSETAKLFITEAFPWVQVGDKVHIGILEGDKIQYNSNKKAWLSVTGIRK